MDIKYALLCSAAALSCALNLSQPAEAKQRPAETPAAMEPGEILVTAQRRSESMQNVPITLSVLSGADLKNSQVVTTADLATVTPGLNFSQTQGTAQPRIRGVGTSGIGPGEESAVPLYVDGVYQAFMHGNLFNLSAVKRIEVLKGPQSTLYGRNAVGGAIVIVTEDPQQTPELRLGAEFGSFARKEVSSYVTGGLTSTLSANLAMKYSLDRGYIKDLLRGGYVNPSKNASVRGKLLWQPSPDASFKLTVNHDHVDDPTGTSIHPVDGVTQSRATNPNVFLASDYNAKLDTKPVNISNLTGASLTSTIGIGSLTLDLLGSYADADSTQILDGDGTEINTSVTVFVRTSKTWTGEARLSSPAENPLSWTIGAYYFNDDSAYAPLTTTRGANVFVGNQKANAHDVFGEATYAFNDSISLTGGLRYGEEKRAKTLYRNGTFLGFGETSFNNLSPRLSLKVKINDYIRSYVTYSQGYKSGLYNLSDTTFPFKPVSPEKNEAYEVGMKSNLGNGSYFNISAFYYDYTNLQVLAAGIGAGNTSILQNAATSEIYGSEADLFLRLTPNWNLKIAPSWTHARYKSFPNAAVTLPLPSGLGGSATVRNASGNPVARSPDYTITVSTDYSWQMFGGTMTTSATYYYRSKFYWDPVMDFKEDPINLVSSRLSWKTADERLNFYIFGSNLLDEKYNLYAVQATASRGAVLARPRTVGIGANLTFQ
ncbi:MAG TPA: TonB-dependent receptor [Novosphingobium sp.]